MSEQAFSPAGCCPPARGSGRARLVVGAVLALVAVAGYLIFLRGRELRGAEARSLVAYGATLLDVRTPDEFNQEHLPGAVNIPIQEFERCLAEVGAPDHDLVVYCRSGHRSGQAAQILRAHGFTKVHDLGPMAAW
jgi:rhodanese-related sulfurtransferase